MAPLTIGVAGNCQVKPLAQWLKTSIPDCTLLLLPPYHLLASNSQIDNWIESCKDADFVLAMPVKNGYRDMESIGTDIFRQKIGSRIHFIPNLYCDAFFPFFGYSRYRNQTVATATVYGDSPHGDYHDFLAMAIARSRIRWGRIQRTRLAIACKSQKATIVKNSDASLRELKHRLDQMNCVMRLDRIPLNSFMGHTFNHPCAALLNELYSSIWTKILNYSPSTFIPVDGEPFANDGQLPVMDFIVKALQRTGLLNTNAPFSRNVISSDAYEEILKKSIRFYLKHQEIIETNILNPKMKLARRFLNLGLHDR